MRKHDCLLLARQDLREEQEAVQDFMEDSRASAGM